MGQYYRVIFLSDDGEIIRWSESSDGVKIMEHAYVDNRFMKFIEQHIYKKPIKIVWAGDYAAKESINDDYISVVNALKQIIYNEEMMRHKKKGMHVDAAKIILKKKVGEALNEEEKETIAFALEFKRHNLYNICDELNHRDYIVPQNIASHYKYQYIINHSKKDFVDMTKLQTNIHPLPLLTQETAAGGGGDYRGRNEAHLGCWARDLISTDDARPTDYTEFVTDFCEE